MSVISQGSQAFLPLWPGEKSIRARVTCRASGEMVAVNGLTFPCKSAVLNHEVSQTLEGCNFVVCKRIKSWAHDDMEGSPPPTATHTHTHTHIYCLQERHSFCWRQSHPSVKALTSSFAAVWKQTCWCQRFCSLWLSVTQGTSPLGALMTDFTITVMWLMFVAPTITWHVCLPSSGHL